MHMLYLAHKPRGLLERAIRLLWYVRAPQIEEKRQRVLPSGCAQIILNLSRDHLVDCDEKGRLERISPSLIVGQRSKYEIIHASDLTELIGVVLEPGYLPILASEGADLFSNRSLPLDGIWGTEAQSLRDNLRELPCWRSWRCVSKTAASSRIPPLRLRWSVSTRLRQ